jgi:hypothetical protein
MRRLLLIILSITFLCRCALAQNVQIALDGAADLSPVYVTTRIPTNAREIVAVFSNDDQKQHGIETKVTSIAAAGKYTLRLIEIHEQPWFPQFLRGQVVDGLQMILAIRIFEAPARYSLTLLSLLFIPIATWLFVPFRRPFRWSRPFWTI